MTDYAPVLASAGSGAATGFAVGGPWGALAGGVLGGVVGLLAQANAEKDQKKRDALIAQAKAQYDAIVPPDPESQKVAFSELQSAGVYTPELEQIFAQPDTEMNKITLDPRMKQAQYDALARLQQLGQSGMDLQDELDVQKAKSRYEQEAANQQAAVQEQMARRGLSSSGMEAVQSQMAGQSAANRMNEYEREIQAQAQRRALEAILQSGQVASQLRGQDWQEQAERAKAQDVINSFNTRNTQGVAGSNVDRTNNAALKNLDSKQHVLDVNYGANNTAIMHNAGLPQQDFQNKMSVASAKNGITATQAAQAGQDAQSKMNTFSGLMQAAGQGGAQYAQYKSGQNRDKIEQDKLDWEKEKWRREHEEGAV